MVSDGQEEPDEVNKNKHSGKSQQTDGFGLLDLLQSQNKIIFKSKVLLIHSAHVEVVGGSRCTEVGGDGGERREQDEADGVPHQVPLVVPHGRGEEPAGEGPGVARHSVLLVAELAGVLVD